MSQFTQFLWNTLGKNSVFALAETLPTSATLPTSTQYDNVKKNYPRWEEGTQSKVVKIKPEWKKTLLSTLTLRWRYPIPSLPQGEIFTQETICLREKINICLKYLLPTCQPSNLSNFLKNKKGTNIRQNRPKKWMQNSRSSFCIINCLAMVISK